MSSSTPVPKIVMDRENATKRFFKEWGQYTMARKAVALSRENKIKTQPGIYHNLVAWMNKTSKARTDKSRGGLGNRVIDELELNMFAPKWYTSTKPVALQYANKGLELILQGLPRPKLLNMIASLPAPEKTDSKYKAFAKVHTEYQEVMGAVESMGNKKVSMEQKDDLFDRVLHPLAAKIIRRTIAARRMPNKKAFPDSAELAEDFAYVASINPAYALDVIKREIPKLEKRFTNALSKFSGSDAKSYLKDVHRDIFGIADPRLKDKSIDNYFDMLYSTIKA